MYLTWIWDKKNVHFNQEFDITKFDCIMFLQSQFKNIEQFYLCKTTIVGYDAETWKHIVKGYDHKVEFFFSWEFGPG